MTREQEKQVLKVDCRCPQCKKLIKNFEEVYFTISNCKCFTCEHVYADFLAVKEEMIYGN